MSCTEYPCCKACKAKVNSINGTSSGDRTVTMFSWIIEDLFKDAEGVSLPEKLLGAPAHKFHITPKDIVYSVTRV